MEVLAHEGCAHVDPAQGALELGREHGRLIARGLLDGFHGRAMRKQQEGREQAADQAHHDEGLDQLKTRLTAGRGETGGNGDPVQARLQNNG